MSTAGRFFKRSGLIASGPGAVQFSTDEIACRMSEKRREGARSGNEGTLHAPYMAGIADLKKIQ